MSAIADFMCEWLRSRSYRRADSDRHGEVAKADVGDLTVNLGISANKGEWDDDPDDELEEVECATTISPLLVLVIGCNE